MSSERSPTSYRLALTPMAYIHYPLGILCGCFITSHGKETQRPYWSTGCEATSFGDFSKMIVGLRPFIEQTPNGTDWSICSSRTFSSRSVCSTRLQPSSITSWIVSTLTNPNFKDDLKLIKELAADQVAVVQSLSSVSVHFWRLCEGSNARHLLSFFKLERLYLP